MKKQYSTPALTVTMAEALDILTLSLANYNDGDKTDRVRWEIAAL